MGSFVHLHVHTEYSLLDGMCRVKDLARRTAELGMDAVAITDHGAMYGTIEFYQACKEHNVRPIIGIETYMALRSMADRDPVSDRDSYHLLLLAADHTGYQNLLKIASASQLEGFYYRPRIDHDFLAAHSEGLICTTGCMNSEVPRLLREGREQEARRSLGWYREVFGPDRFYIELQEHDIPELRQLNRALIDLASWAQLPLLATNDVHYVHREDADPHDVLLCIGTNSLVSQQNRKRFTGNSYYLRSPEEMSALFAEVPEAITGTVRVAEMCNVVLADKQYHLPEFPLPEGFDAEGYLRHLCEEGLVRRYGSRAESEEVRQRLEYELQTIHRMGFDTYFLIVWDLCEFARSRDIWWNARGSGPGSIVAYVLGITNIDPLENRLLFERFLNPGRISMPDIDLDYPDDRRAEMIEYCMRRYGEDRVAQIITFGTLGARAAIRDVGRALDIPLNEVDQLARLIPTISGKTFAIRKALDSVPELRAAYEDPTRPYVRRLIDTAALLEGISRHASTHAAGVLIADRPLVEYAPLHRPTRDSEGKGNGGDGNEMLGAICQWSMEAVESIGLLKVDFLGLRTLTIMRKACELIEHYHGVHYDLSNIPYRHHPDDPEYNARLDAAFALLTRGETDGVFQVEGGGMTRMLTEMRPSRFEHIVAAISLFRPGPIEYIQTYIRRMHGEEPVTYHHDLLEPILSETYGIIVYQEQIMQIASELFGYELGDADLMRRAVAKKKEKDLKKHRARFRAQGPAHGIPAEVAERIFDDIEFFARYGFNKSHAADYAVLTMQTAFLKAHYPHEYMTALLTIERGDTAKVGRYIYDCRRHGIEVLPPDIQSSERDFTIEPQPDGSRAIRYGLGAIKNVGDGAVEEILTARRSGPFRDLTDFCQRVDLRAVGRRALECLIKVGALDSFAPRGQLLESLDRLLGFSSSLHRAAEVGQMSLFGEATGVQLDSHAAGVLVNDVQTEYTRREMLQWERELVGAYISEHPLQAVMDKIDRMVNAHCGQLTEADHGRQVTMAGIVNSIHTITTRSGRPMAFAILEDLFGTIEVVVWPSTWEETRELWQPDHILLVRGKIDARRGDPKLLCEEATNNFDIWQAMDEPQAGHSWGLPSRDNGYEEPPPLDYNDTSYYTSPSDYAYDDNGYIPAEAEVGQQPAIPSAPNDEPAPELEGAEPLAEPVPELRPTSTGSGLQQMLPASRRPQIPARSTERLHVRILIRRSGDLERDKRRLARAHGLLVSHPGKHTFSFVLVDPGGCVEIDFSSETTHYCDELHRQLARIVGEDAIQVLSLEQDERDSSRNN